MTTKLRLSEWNNVECSGNDTKQFIFKSVCGNILGSVGGSVVQFRRKATPIISVCASGSRQRCHEMEE